MEELTVNQTTPENSDSPQSSPTNTSFYTLQNILMVVGVLLLIGVFSVSAYFLGKNSSNTNTQQTTTQTDREPTNIQETAPARVVTQIIRTTNYSCTTDDDCPQPGYFCQPEDPNCKETAYHCVDGACSDIDPNGQDVCRVFGSCATDVDCATGLICNFIPGGKGCTQSQCPARKLK